MLLHVQNMITKKDFSIEYKPTDTIYEMKEKLAVSTGIPVSEQKTIAHPIELQNFRTMGDYPLRWGVMLFKQVHLRVNRDGLIVHPLDGSIVHPTEEKSPIIQNFESDDVELIWTMNEYDRRYPDIETTTSLLNAAPEFLTMAFASLQTGPESGMSSHAGYLALIAVSKTDLDEKKKSGAVFPYKPGRGGMNGSLLDPGRDIPVITCAAVYYHPEEGVKILQNPDPRIHYSVKYRDRLTDLQTSIAKWNTQTETAQSSLDDAAFEGVANTIEQEIEFAMKYVTRSEVASVIDQLDRVYEILSLSRAIPAAGFGKQPGLELFGNTILSLIHTGWSRVAQELSEDAYLRQVIGLIESRIAVLNHSAAAVASSNASGVSSFSGEPQHVLSGTSSRPLESSYTLELARASFVDRIKDPKTRNDIDFALHHYFNVTRFSPESFNEVLCQLIANHKNPIQFARALWEFNATVEDAGLISELNSLDDPMQYEPQLSDNASQEENITYSYAASSVPVISQEVVENTRADHHDVLDGAIDREEFSDSIDDPKTKNDVDSALEYYSNVTQSSPEIFSDVLCQLIKNHKNPMQLARAFWKFKATVEDAGLISDLYSLDNPMQYKGQMPVSSSSSQSAFFKPEPAVSQELPMHLRDYRALPTEFKQYLSEKASEFCQSHDVDPISPKNYWKLFEILVDKSKSDLVEDYKKERPEHQPTPR